MDFIPTLALTLLGSLVLTRLLMPAARRLGAVWGLVDHPSWRRRQKAAVPCSGGLVVYVVGVAAGLTLLLTVGPPFDPTALLALGLAGLGTVILGVADDRFGLHAEKKLLGQVIVVSLPMAAGLTLHHISLPGVGSLQLGLMTGPVTLFWYLGFINSLNLIDGLDGLAAGIVAVVLGTLLLGVVGVDPIGALWLVALLGAVVGFLRDNLSADRIFLGDAGSMLLGLWLAGLTLGLAQSNPALPVVAILAMAVPVMDTASTIVRRWRRGVSMFRPDAEHLHHRLLHLGIPPLRVTLCLWAVSAGASALAAVILGHPAAALLATSLWALAALEVAYSLQRDRHPSVRRVLGFLLGLTPTLWPADPVEALAEVIEMERYRPRMPGLAHEEVPSAQPTVTAPAQAPPARAKEDVVLAVPDESAR